VRPTALLWQTHTFSQCGVKAQLLSLYVSLAVVYEAELVVSKCAIHSHSIYCGTTACCMLICQCKKKLLTLSDASL